MNSRLNVVLHFGCYKKRYLVKRSTLKQKVSRRLGLSSDCVFERKEGDNWSVVEPELINDFDNIRVSGMELETPENSMTDAITSNRGNPYTLLRQKLKKGLDLSSHEKDFLCDVLDVRKKPLSHDVQKETEDKAVQVAKATEDQHTIIQTSKSPERVTDPEREECEKLTTEDQNIIIQALKSSDKMTDPKRKESEKQNKKEPKKLTRASKRGRKQQRHEGTKLENPKKKLKKADQTKDRKLIAEWQKLMKNELSKKEPNDDTIRKLMDLTFGARQSYILLDCPRIRQVQQTYPALFSIKEVIREFGRVKSSVCLERFQKNLQKYSSVLIAKAPESPLLFISDLVHTKLLSASEEEKNYFECVAAILLLPSFLNENPTTFMSFAEEKKSVYPLITCNRSLEEIFDRDTNFSVLVEMKRLCESKNLIEIFFAFIAAFYIFNIEYADKYIKTVTLCESILLEMSSSHSSEVEAVKRFILSENQKTN